MSKEDLDDKKKKLGTITKAKEELGKELGITYHGIDHMYYQKKTTSFHGKLLFKENQKEVKVNE